MEVSIQEIISAMRRYNKQASKGHLLPTDNKNQCIYFEESTNTRLITEYTDDLTIYSIPQQIIIPSQNDVKNFESFISTSINEDDIKEMINIIVESDYQKELVFIVCKLAITGKGKAIILK